MPSRSSYVTRHVRSAPRSGMSISARPGRGTTWCGCELFWRAALGPEPFSCSTVRGGAKGSTSSGKYGGEPDRGVARTVPELYCAFGHATRQCVVHARKRDKQKSVTHVQDSHSRRTGPPSSQATNRGSHHRLGFLRLWCRCQSRRM